MARSNKAITSASLAPSIVTAATTSPCVSATNTDTGPDAFDTTYSTIASARARFMHAILRALAAEIAARALQAKGLLLTLDYLGESVTTIEQATAATREYTHLMDDIVAADIERNVSVKLTQLGLAIDRATCVDNMRRILEPARQHGFFVRIDMENSPYTDVTLEVFETLWNLEYRNIGVVLQSYLFRTERDLRRIGGRIELAGRLRGRHLVGEQREPTLAVRHGVIANGARTGVELAHRGDEEAAAGEDALLDVGEEQLGVGAEAGQAGRGLGRGLDDQVLEDRARRFDRRQLELLLGAEVREQPALAHAHGLRQAGKREPVQSLDRGQACGLAQDCRAAALAVGPPAARRGLGPLCDLRRHPLTS